MRFMIFTAMLLAATAAAAAETTGTAMRHELRNGRVVIPEWDNVRPPHRGEIRLGPSDFEKPANVYNNRVIFQYGTIRTRLVDVPATASQFMLFARAEAEEDIFPRIRVTFEQNAPATAIRLFEGHFQSHPSDYLWVPLPRGIAAKHGRFVFEFLNPSRLNDWRSLWISFTGVR